MLGWVGGSVDRSIDQVQITAHTVHKKEKKKKKQKEEKEENKKKKREDEKKSEKKCSPAGN